MIKYYLLIVANPLSDSDAAVADEYFEKKKECNDDDDKGRIDDVAD